jgi:hypothetical protein
MKILSPDIVEGSFETMFNHHPFRAISTGSREIYFEGTHLYEQNVTDQSDEDYVVLAPPNLSLNTIKLMLDSQGWTFGGSVPPEGTTSDFMSFKKNFGGEAIPFFVNYIVVNNPREFAKWKVATKVAKTFQPTNKEERILLFKSVFKAFD